MLDLLTNSVGFAEIDIFMLGTLCNALAQYETATKVLEKEGQYYSTPGGLKRLHPMNTIQQDAMKTITQIGSSFGLSPKSRDLMKNFALKYLKH